jgi:glycosyltransferase involved in cell wall biosynthesis
VIRDGAYDSEELKMRIMVYYPDMSETTGGSRLAIEVAEALNRYGHKTYMLTENYHSGVPIKFRKSDINILCIKRFGSKGANSLQSEIISSISLPHYCYLIKKIVEKYSIEAIIYVGAYNLIPFLEKFCPRIKHIPYVFFPSSLRYEYTFDEIFENWSWRRHIKLKMVDEKSFKDADLILCISEFVKSIVKEFFDVEAKVLYEPVDIDFFYPDWSKKSYNVVLTVSRFMPRKRVDAIIEQFKRLKGNYRLIIAGGPIRGFEEVFFKIKKRASDDKRIIFSINPTDIELRDLYQKAGLFWYMGEEHHIWTPLEAMACGTPAIILKQRGLNHGIIDGINGKIASTEDQFPKLTRTLMEDKERLLLMGKKAREHIVDNFSVISFRRKLAFYISQLDNKN